MRKDVSGAARIMADLAPALMSGVELDFFAKHSITNSQWITLMAIYSSGGCSMGYLSERMRIAMPTVTGLIDRLYNLGFVQRQSPPEDRRKVIVELTKDGHRLVREFKVVVRRRWSTLLENLTAEEIKTYKKVLGKFKIYLMQEKNKIKRIN